jgi:hypothetical protein
MATKKSAIGKLKPVLARVSSDLRELERSWALIGGVAVGVRSEPRFTRDLDVAVAVRDDVDAEGLVFALGQRGYAIKATLEQKVLGRLATIRAVYGGVTQSGVIVDFLMCSSGIEASPCSMRNSPSRGRVSRFPWREWATL